jgi:DNA helicase-2/ATP-dependent DNA helicase PcrA
VHRDNLDAFLAVVGEFRAVEGASDLSALLAYLAEESASGRGLDQRPPRERDAVQLLTSHRAKGLEFRAVFVVGLTESVFPGTRAPALWTRKPSELPIPLRGDAVELPSLRGYDAAAIKQFLQDAQEHHATEELRLGYVAFTRAARLLVLSGCWWRKENVRPNGPSEFLSLARRFVVGLGREPLVWWPPPEEGARNPSTSASVTFSWPVDEDAAEAERRRGGAALVRAALVDPAPDVACEDGRVAIWDAELARLVEEQERLAAADVEVPWPGSLSATAVMAFHHEPQEFLLSVVRPMPRRPSRAARFGTRFHEWVEQQLAPQASRPLLDLATLPGREDADVRDEADLEDLASRFLASPFGQRADGRVEVPFSLSLGGQTIHGRIDAVFPDGDGWLVVDWKTNRSHDADPIQLAIYREAWAEARGISADRVRVAFYYVRDGSLVEPDDLPSRAQLEELVGGG